jgi:phosphoglycolate phosphatase-like HAD superfamily hydrolase
MPEEKENEEEEEETSERKVAQRQEYERPERPAEDRPATNVLELLDRILDKGVVIIGDIRISVADIELLKIQIRLLIASVDKAKELGIDFAWAREIEQTKSKDELEQKVKELEEKLRKKG